MMRRYIQLLARRDFALLWVGATVSLFGDALTWVALVWLVYELTGSSAGVGLLVVAYTAPVVVGGLMAGMLLDRFDQRHVLIGDNLVRGTCMAAIPILFHAGQLQLWHLYAAAAVHGLLKMISLAGFPSLLTTLVPDEERNTANAMESIGFAVGGVAGPAVAGILIGPLGAANLIGLDALSYALFAVCVAGLAAPPAAPQTGTAAPWLSLRPALRFIWNSPAVRAITLMFMLANVGGGILSVLLPVYTKTVLHGDAATYGLLLSVTAVGGLVGSVLAGALAWPWTLGRSVAGAQLSAGAALLGLLWLPGLPLTIGALTLSDFLQSPLTIWAQTIRMRLIPPALRGRAFSLLRTLMQATPPIGGALGGWLLTGLTAQPVILLMSLVIAVPGALGLLHSALAHERTLAGEETT